jgi:hypothetical protein
VVANDEAKSIGGVTKKKLRIWRSLADAEKSPAQGSRQLAAEKWQIWGGGGPGGVCVGKGESCCICLICWGLEGTLEFFRLFGL